MGTRKNKSEDVGERLTEMLDEQPGQDIEVVRDNTPPPPPGQSLQQLDAELVSDYHKVDAMEKAGTIDKQFVKDLAERMRAVAENPQLRGLVSFDSVHATAQLDLVYEMATGARRESTTDVWHYRVVKYR